MKVTLPETAVNTLRDILKDNQGKPTSIRVYFAGNGCGGPSFGLALDEKNDQDLTYEVEGLNFVMNIVEYETYGDITIEDTGYGFSISAANAPSGGGCGGCGGGCC